ncbi:MAG: alpha/beta hydrolase-fold protein [Pseudomonadota bacterium]
MLPCRTSALGFLTLSLTLQTAPATSENELPLAGLHGLGRVEYGVTQSNNPKRSYYTYVRIPEEEPGENGFPTIYLLDGGITFPLLAAYYRYLRLADEVPPMLIVGISYPSNTFEGGNYRSTDFTAPSPERDYWGGADQFRQRLVESVFPFVERRYNGDPNQRLLFGQSLGGQFAIDTAFHAPELFAGLIASNPALHRNLDHFTDPDKIRSDVASPPRLFVSAAENDHPDFRGPARAWIEFWQDRPLPLQLKIYRPAGHNHFTPAPAAFRAGLRWLLDDSPSP